MMGLVLPASSAVVVRAPKPVVLVPAFAFQSGIKAETAPMLNLGAISDRYGINPDLDLPADLGEGSYGEVRSASMGRAVKIPYEGVPEGMIRHEAAIAKRVQAAGGEEIFVRAEVDPELGVLVMDRLDGFQQIGDWIIDRDGIGRRTFVRIKNQLENGLAVLEAAGVVHSDLKWDNILIGPHGKIKIVDFGIAADQGGYLPLPDFEGWRGGDFNYISPNQLRNGPAEFADDQFSVNVHLSRLANKVR